MHYVTLSAIASLALSAAAAPLAASPMVLGNGHVQLQFSIDLGGQGAAGANAAGSVTSN